MAGKKHVTISFVTDVPNENIASITKIIDLVEDLTIHVDNIDPRPTLIEAASPKPKKVTEATEAQRPKYAHAKVDGTNTWKRWRDDPRCVWKRDQYRRLSLDAEATLVKIGLTTSQLFSGKFPKRSLETALKHSFARTLGYKLRDMRIKNEEKARANGVATT